MIFQRGSSRAPTAATALSFALIALIDTAISNPLLRGLDLPFDTKSSQSTVSIPTQDFSRSHKLSPNSEQARFELERGFRSKKKNQFSLLQTSITPLATNTLHFDSPVTIDRSAYIMVQLWEGRIMEDMNVNTFRSNCLVRQICKQDGITFSYQMDLQCRTDIYSSQQGVCFLAALKSFVNPRLLLLLAILVSRLLHLLATLLPRVAAETLTTVKALANGACPSVAFVVDLGVAADVVVECAK